MLCDIMRYKSRVVEPHERGAAKCSDRQSSDSDYGSGSGGDCSVSGNLRYMSSLNVFVGHTVD
jgi:hypothetical protein